MFEGWRFAVLEAGGKTLEAVEAVRLACHDKADLLRDVRATSSRIGVAKRYFKFARRCVRQTEQFGEGQSCARGSGCPQA